MEIYLIRHTKPAIAPGICYGQSDVDVAPTFVDEAEHVKRLLPARFGKVYASPLKRCRTLADYLFPQAAIDYANDLKEINCGRWELKNWNEMDAAQLQNWMNDFVNVCFPGGENFVQVMARTQRFLQTLEGRTDNVVTVITHAGVIRSFLVLLQGMAPEKTFDVAVPYGAVIHLNTRVGTQGWATAKHDTQGMQTIGTVYTAGLLVVKEGKLLLAYSKNKRAWYLPGGKIGANESAVDALLREIGEELNVRLDAASLRYYCHITAPAFGETDDVMMEQDCFCYDLTEKPEPGHEIGAVGYFDRQDYLQQPVQAPGVLLVFERLANDGFL